MPPSNRLEALKWSMAGNYRIRINDQWCVSASTAAMHLTLRFWTITERLQMPRQGLLLIHPGAFLAEILQELEISQSEFARTIGKSPMRISHIIRGTRPVTAELALLFGKAFGQSPQYWLNLQAAHDLARARKTTGKRLRRVPQIAPVP
jgi:antitoxin HigA-1